MGGGGELEYFLNLNFDLELKLQVKPYLHWVLYKISLYLQNISKYIVDYQTLYRLVVIQQNYDFLLRAVGKLNITFVDNLLEE